MNVRMMIILLALVAGSALLSSCETVAGFGRDIQRAGQGLENSGQGREW